MSVHAMLSIAKCHPAGKAGDVIGGLSIKTEPVPLVVKGI